MIVPFVCHTVNTFPSTTYQARGRSGWIFQSAVIPDTLVGGLRTLGSYLCCCDLVSTHLRHSRVVASVGPAESTIELVCIYSALLPFYLITTRRLLRLQTPENKSSFSATLFTCPNLYHIEIECPCSNMWPLYKGEESAGWLDGQRERDQEHIRQSAFVVVAWMKPKDASCAFTSVLRICAELSPPAVAAILTITWGLFIL